MHIRVEFENSIETVATGYPEGNCHVAAISDLLILDKERGLLVDTQYKQIAGGWHQLRYRGKDSNDWTQTYEEEDPIVLVSPENLEKVLGVYVDGVLFADCSTGKLARIKPTAIEYDDYDQPDRYRPQQEQEKDVQEPARNEISR